MGLRGYARHMILKSGFDVPAFLVRPKERMLYAELNRLKPGAVVLDLGASVGRTVELFAERGAVVHAVEPNPDAFALLRDRVGGRPNVVLYPVAVGDADGTARLYLHNDYVSESPSHLESSSVIAEKSNVDPERFYEVPVRDVAGLIAEIGVPIALVKVDVEGAEYRVLRRLIEAGCMDRIARVVVETHADRIESLRAAHDETAALIGAGGLWPKIAFGWE